MKFFIRPVLWALLWSILLLCNNPTAYAQPRSAETLNALLTAGLSAHERVDVLAELAYNTVWDDANEAYELARQGIRLADSIGYAFGKAKCESEAGLALLYMGFIPEAFEILLKSIEVLEDQGDDFWCFTTWSSFAYIGWDQEEHRDALSYLSKAKPHADKLDIDNFSISILSDIGESYRRMGELDSAYFYFEKGYELAVTSQDTFQLAVLGNQLGMALIPRDRIEEGLRYARKSLPLSAAAGWNPRITYHTLAEGFMELNQPDSVIHYGKRCIRAAREGSFLDALITSAHSLLAEAYQRKGNADSAMVHLRKGTEVYKQIVNLEKARRIQGLVFERELYEERLEQARREAAISADLRRQRFAKNAGFGGLALLFMFSSILFNRFRLTSRQKKVIESEKHRADKLLLNILPVKIADELKEEGRTKAVRYEEATVLFTDFVGFTSIGQEMSAQELVEELHVCFSEFDAILAKRNIDKIKTIGDSYMCAAGVPEASGTHAGDIVAAALDISQFMEERAKVLAALGRRTFPIRIGIHTGPVVGGVVGSTKFAFDIWGNTVNIASRMESCSEPGKVNISHATYERISADSRFAIEPRGMKAVKGLGEMRMYFVTESSGPDVPS